ncbi:MAG: hypothetical protein JNK24_01975 [Alphaproteobacteria bacterium]|nr:hypothetical protein [Alphaproteobacteria bacterium]
MVQRVKLVVYVPVTHTNVVLAAMGDAGAGVIGNYTHCSFVSQGKGQFLPNDKANPFIGKCGILEIVDESRIEVTVFKERLEYVIKAMKSTHPYEEVAFDVYVLEDV